MASKRSSSGRPRPRGWLRVLDGVISGGFLYHGSYALAWAGGLAVMLLATVTFVTVAGRYSPWSGSWLTGGFEISEFLMSMLSVFAISYCWYVDAHIRIRTITGRFSPRIKAIFDAAAAFLLLIAVAGFVWGEAVVSRDSLAIGSKSPNTGLSIGIFQFVFAAVMAHFGLVLLRSLIGFVAKARGHQEAEDRNLSQPSLDSVV